jgi:hypothetical protein
MNGRLSFLADELALMHREPLVTWDLVPIFELNSFGSKATTRLSLP